MILKARPVRVEGNCEQDVFHKNARERQQKLYLVLQKTLVLVLGLLLFLISAQIAFAENSRTHVGIPKYKEDKPEEPLDEDKYMLKDAEKIGKGFTDGPDYKEHVEHSEQLLRGKQEGEEASKDNIQKNMETDPKDNENYVFTVVAHGGPVMMFGPGLFTTDGWLLPQDVVDWLVCEEKDEDEKIVEKLRTKKAFLLFHFCFSKEFLEKLNAIIKERGLEKEFENVAIIASGSGEHGYPTAENSAIAEYTYKGLVGEADGWGPEGKDDHKKDDKVIVEELYNYLKQSCDKDGTKGLTWNEKAGDKILTMIKHPPADGTKCSLEGCHDFPSHDPSCFSCHAQIQSIVGYSTPWLIFTMATLMLSGGYLFYRRQGRFV